MIFTRGAATKLRNFNGGSSTGIRDELNFFRKRTSCKCLKEMHLEARKASPKMGLCYHCDKVEERTLLMVCSRCRIAQYCSMECHMVGWSEHKCSCDKFVSFQKQQKQEAEKRWTVMDFYYEKECWYGFGWFGDHKSIIAIEYSLPRRLRNS